MDASYLVESDSSARRAAVSAVGWLVLAVSVGIVLQAAALWPGAFRKVDLLSYGRLRAMQDTLAVFGWLTTAGFAAAYTIVPRVAGAGLHNERLGRVGIGIWNVFLFVGAFVLMFGSNQGRPLGELPVGIDVALAVVMAFTAYNVGATLVRRRERTLYPSAWYLLAGVVFLPIVYVVGNLTVFQGVRDAIVSGFYVQGLYWLWLAPVGLGAAYYIFPTATGNPLHSRRLASIGFWSLVVAGGWTGQRAMVWGPGQDYLETIAIAMSAVLLVPVLSAASNLFATAKGRWGLIADDFGLRFAAVGVVLLAAWAGLAAASSNRPVARVLGLTVWEAGLRHLAVYGAFSCLFFAVLYHAYPRVMGRAWYSRRMASFHFWGTVLGAGAGATAHFALGLAQGSAALASATTGSRPHEVAGAADFPALAAASFVVFAVAQYAFAWNAYRTVSRGDPVHLVAPAAQPAGVA